MELIKIKKTGVLIVAITTSFVIGSLPENLWFNVGQMKSEPEFISQKAKEDFSGNRLEDFAKVKKKKKKKARKRQKQKVRKKVLTQSQSFSTKKNGKNKTNLDFDAVDVDGQRKTASGSMITNIKASDPDAMLPIRKHFRDVMSETSLIAED